MAVGFKLKRGTQAIALEDGETYLNKEKSTIQIGNDSSLITLVPINTPVDGDIILLGKLIGTATNATNAVNAESASISTQSLIALHALTADTLLSDNYIKSDMDIQTIEGSLIINKDLDVRGVITTHQTISTSKLVVDQNTITITGKPKQVPNASINVVDSSTNKIVSGLSYNLVDEKWNLDKPLVVNIEGTSTHSNTSETSIKSQTADYSTNSQNAEQSINAHFINNDKTNAFIHGGNILGENARFGVKDNKGIIFITNNKDQIIIDNTGKLGLNTLKPEATLHVVGNSKITNGLEVAGGIVGDLVGNATTSTNATNADTAKQSLYPIKTNGTSIYSVINGDYNVNGNSNIFLGTNAGDKAYEVINSNFIGNNAGNTAINAKGSNFIGYMAGYMARSAEHSNFIGYEAGESAINASNSILIGNKAGKNIEGNGIGDNNIVIGNNITLSENQTNSLNIGGAIFAKDIYSDKSGNPYPAEVSEAKVGIGTSNPTCTLDINGLFRLTPMELLPTEAPIGSLAVSGSGDDLNVYLYTGTGKTGWRKLFLYLPNEY